MNDKLTRGVSFIEKGFCFVFNVSKNILRTRKARKTIQSYKNMYVGKRCFIIGNGPSLTVSDLEKLKNEYTFGSNGIFKIFKKTSWRPTFYVSQDKKVLENYWDEIENLDITAKFIPLWIVGKYKNSNRMIFLSLCCKDKYPELPDFSEDVSKVIYEGFTVTYSMIQLAIYMGFREIYIIGCDHSYSAEKKADGTVVVNKEVKDHFSSDYGMEDWSSGKFYLPQLDKSTLAYVAAKKYADAHNIKILNATRGGKLEVFERVSFDEIL